VVPCAQHFATRAPDACPARRWGFSGNKVPVTEADGDQDLDIGEHLVNGHVHLHVHLPLHSSCPVSLVWYGMVWYGIV